MQLYMLIRISKVFSVSSQERSDHFNIVQRIRGGLIGDWIYKSIH